jgi:hypothetical protein
LRNLFNVFGVIGLTAGPVAAQEFVIVAQPCSHPLEVIEKTAEYQELPLFTATGFQLSAATGELLGGRMMVWVNPDTGTWTLAVLYPDSEVACLIVSGHSFEPYSE